MILHAPSAYQKSFYQRPVEKDLQGLDGFAKKLAGIWRRRPMVRKPWQQRVEEALAIWKDLESLGEGALNERIEECRMRFDHHESLPSAEALAVVCEVASRTIRLKPYPVQMLAVLALWGGYMAEIDTGEGKTLSIALVAVFAAWSGEPCHIVTANDYLAARDAKTMHRFLARLGVTVGVVVGETEEVERRRAYYRMVTYTTAKEVAADYLRDRLRLQEWDRSGRRQFFRKVARTPDGRVELVQQGLFRAFIDEADNCLIDEAVTPLLISQPQREEHLEEACQAAWFIAERLGEGRDYVIRPVERMIDVTAAGRTAAEKLGGFPESALWRCPRRRLQMILLALEAKEFFERGVHYILENEKVVIVDEGTGRPMPNRSWKLGLHQMVEAKERVELTAPSQTIAQISFQAFFKKYKIMAGATGTAREIADEVWSIYSVPSVRIPRNRPNRRKYQGIIYCTNQEERDERILSEIEGMVGKGQPVLVGTRSVSSSEELGRRLSFRGIDCEILNATRLAHEAAIIAKAGGAKKVTIATNMAGRGTDIELGYGVAEAGGLHVVATEPHESRRVDRQLFGRSGRQGDPGSVVCFYRLDDELFCRNLPSALIRILCRMKRVPGAHIVMRCAQCLAQRRAESLARKRRALVSKNDASLKRSLGFAEER
ncbi:MAG: hypothetical protein QF405_11495 [Roseibacillus sp.]|nr:hypothetical protein [Roseibacillus sp.]HJM65902.1 hypothetical protein [Roseibacillus sp.]